MALIPGSGTLVPIRQHLSTQNNIRLYLISLVKLPHILGSCLLRRVCLLCVFRLWMSKSRFSPHQLPQNCVDLAIGTSRLKYIEGHRTGGEVHAYRGATLLDLCNVLNLYPTQKLETVVVIAGFNDHRLSPSVFVEHWKYLIQIILVKFSPSNLIVPKTIHTSRNISINNKIYRLKFELYKFLESSSLKYLIFSPELNNVLDVRVFCKDTIHFSTYGNHIFTRILKWCFSYFKYNDHRPTNNILLHLHT